MSLLLLFAYPNPASIPISELVTTEPSASNGVAFQREATAGEWRFVLELADPADGTAAIWRDITGYYAGDRYQRGGDTYKGVYRASLADVQLQIDDSDLLAPWGQDTSSIFGTDIRLDAGMLMRLSMIRVESGVVVEWEPTWTMRVETWGDGTAARGQIRTHVVNLVDTIGDLANVPTFINAENSTNWDTWFTDRVLPAAGWLFGVDIYGDTTSSGLPGDLDSTAAGSRMDAGTAPLGLVWRSLRTGRMVIHPAPWDTTNVNRYDNPLLEVYPDGLKFSYFPDTTDIEYIQDDGQQSFGIQRTNAGIINSLQVTWPDGFTTETYVIDDPVSIGRYGVRPFQATWIIANEAAVDDILDDRAHANSQALPLRTTLDLEGFWPAMAIVDQYDPVTIVHATRDDGLVVTGTGVIRNVVEERTYNGAGGLAWQTTVQVDIDATETSPALLPVENLMLVGTNTPLLGGPSSATFSWDDPTQPDITPTEVQLRLLGRSPVWFSQTYPGVGSDGTVLGWLEPATAYTLQVRLVRRVNGVIVAYSATRSVAFTSAARILPVPVPGDDPTDTNVDMPPFEDCEDDVSIQLQENDGTGWVTVDTFSDSEIVQDEDGVWHLVYDIPNSFFNDGSMYRFLGFCGADLIVTGVPFDPPDDWTDPCTTPPALSDPPFDDSSLLVYVPMVCAPDTIKEAVSGLVATHGDALEGILSGVGDPDARALLALADPLWSDAPAGILAYGECPQIVGHTGDRTMTVRVNVADAVACVLFECGGMRINCVPTTGGWRASVDVYKVGSTITLPTSSVLDEGTAYVISATHELATGTITISVDGLIDNTVGGSDNVNLINALPIWRVGAPPESWITDCALFDSVVIPANLADAIIALSPAGYWKFDDPSGTTAVDSSGFGRNGTYTAVTLAGQLGPDGNNYAVFDADADKMEVADNNAWSIDTSGVGLSMGFLIRLSSGASDRNVVYKGIFPSCEWRTDIATASLNATTLIANNTTLRSGHVAPADIAVGDWAAVLVVWPNATAANQVQIYVNGVALSVAHSGAGGSYTNGGSVLGWGNNANGGGSGPSFRGAIAHGFILPYSADATQRAAFFAAAAAEGWY